MDLSQPGHGLAVHDNAGRAARMKIFAGIARIEAEGAVVEGRQKGFHIAFEIKERISAEWNMYSARGALSGCAQANVRMLLSPTAVKFEDMALLKEPNVFRAVIQVVSQHVEHAGYKRGAHHRSFFVQGIGQLCDFCRRRKLLRVGGIDKGKRDSFVVSQGEQ